MSLDHQVYNRLCDYIYGNMCITLEICDDFLTRGNEAGWPQEVWAYVVRVLVTRDLLRLAISTLGEVPVLGTGGSVASAWNTRQYVMTRGGQSQGMINEETEDEGDDRLREGLEGQESSGSGPGGDSI